tara:strand:- start:265 stop:495 length:231 start_codon:yes stop_codon:yes gene_type:complete
MTLLENSIDKIDRLDLTSSSLRYEMKRILLDHLTKELQNEITSFSAEKFVNQICGRSSFNTNLSNLTEPETINHKP